MNESRSGSWPDRVVSFVLGTAVGTAIGALIARRHVASLAVHLRRYADTAGRVDRPVLIVNRWSGGGKAEALGLADAAQRAGIEVVVLERGDDLAELARQAADRGADALGMAGGDGSLGVVASVAVERGLPFFCVPVGTRNHFALDMGLDRDNPLDALRALSGGEQITIDYGLVGGRVFLNNVSLGIYPKAVRKEGYRDEKVKSFLDALTAGAGSGDERPDLCFETPDGQAFETTPLMMISNNEYVLTGPPDFARRRRLDGGLLGVAVMTGVPRDATETLDLRRGDLETWTTDSYFVNARGGVVEAGVDGESIDFPAPVEFEIRPAGLRVLLPSGTRPGYVSRGEAITSEILDLARIGGEPDQ